MSRVILARGLLSDLSGPELGRAARRITRALFVAQSLTSSGTIGALPVFTIVGARLSGEAWAGLPAMVHILGIACAAFVWGELMDRIGRRGMLLGGMSLGALGAAVAGAGVHAASPALLLIGAALLGVGVAAMQLGRFVAAEVHPPVMRGRAIAGVLLGGTVGALFAPIMVTPAAGAVQAMGLDEAIGPFTVAALVFAAAALVVWGWVRPEPRELARVVAVQHLDVDRDEPIRSLSRILRAPAALTAVVTMVCAQLAMGMLMVITSLHMRNHDHSLGSISLVISSHVVGMYAFSAISGRLSDRWGRGPVIGIGAAVLILASLTAPLSPRLLPLAFALFLLGLGWNFCFVGGSALLADQLSPAERARTQGANDFLVGLATATGSLGSGFVFAASGYLGMALVAGTVAVIPLMLAVTVRPRRPLAAVPS